MENQKIENLEKIESNELLENNEELMLDDVEEMALASICRRC